MNELTPEAAEFIPTPRWPVRRLLEAVTLPTGWWYEPCVGNGDLVRAFNGELDGIQWTANDIRTVPDNDAYDALWNVDATRPPPRGERWRVCATNPPFSKALEIAQALIGHCDYLLLLLPLAWPSCAARFDFIREHKPDVLVLPDRVWEFVRDVAWFMWPSQGLGFHVLQQTPLEERRRDALEVEVGRRLGPTQQTLDWGLV